MAFNISDLKEHNEDLLNLLTKHLPDMLWVKERNGNYLYANQAICDGLLMAKDTNEVVGKNDVFFANRERASHPENPQWHTFGELCFNSDLLVLENNKPMKFEEFGNVKGELLYLEVFKAPFYDINGDILGTVGAGRDITKLKQTQLALEESLLTLNSQREQLESFNVELAKRVKEETEKQEKQERIMLHQSRQAAMGELLESIAHQWRQPLNIIGLATMNLETLYEMGSMDSHNFRDKMEIITSNVAYMSNTIDDFRNFINPERGVIVFNCKSSIEDVLKILNDQMKSNNIECIMQTYNEFTLYGVDNEFKQIIMILLNNAIDAIKFHKSNKNKQGQITIKLNRIDNYGVIEIADNGGGISDDIMDKIFDPYFTTKYDSNGTGIGLYIAKNILQTRMNGSLVAKNCADGSCFMIKIPLLDQ